MDTLPPTSPCTNQPPPAPNVFPGMPELPPHAPDEAPLNNPPPIGTASWVSYNTGWNDGYVRGYYVAVNMMNAREGQRQHRIYNNRRGRGRGRGRGGGWGGRGRGRGRGGHSYGNRSYTRTPVDQSAEMFPPLVSSTNTATGQEIQFNDQAVNVPSNE